MNVTEANAVNVLLAFVLDDTDDSGGRLREACIYLAGRAHNALHAGLRSEDVEARWPQ